MRRLPRPCADPDALARVLAAAAVYGLVRRDETGRYALTGTGELFRTDVERTRAQHEALMAEAGYALVRDTHLARVLPWRILEFQRQ